MTEGELAGEVERALGARLSAKVQETRRLQGLSLDALARRASLSKGTVVAIEQGKANPSIGVLCRLAAAFALSVSDLLGQADAGIKGDPVELTVPVVLWKTALGSEATLAASISGSTMFELWTWAIAPGDIYHSDAHSWGTRELIRVQQGTLEIEVGDKRLILNEGCAARLEADQPHSYAALGDLPVLFSMAVLERVINP